jgi:hypothetical protein
MKALFIAMALFAANNALAARDCTPYVDPTTIGGESGNAEWIYPCGPNYTVEHRACNEGEVAYDSVLDPSGNFYMQVPVVCHNGTFVPKAAPVQHRGCTEGEISYSNELDPSGNFYQDVTLVCHNGRFVRR